MSLAATNLDIDELEAEISAENERRYAFYRMLHSTDRVLWRLEEFNCQGIKTISDAMRQRMANSLAGLPLECRMLFSGSNVVQDLLDSVFEIQEALFRWHDPGREVSNDDLKEAVPDDLDDQILGHLVAHPEGLGPNDLAALFPSTLRESARRRVSLMATEGRVRLETSQGRAGTPRRRYFAVREG